ncbi:alkaline phosphatase family protein [Brevundimonas goettingensis]|uniref:Alkaline phosphatase family protein n=1 Tax=Brevundimonas goettingensis TaxID=2774190 RepID=A0A975GVS3_9CAUL|nr:ectonucleotide pyrophosphatase/phosphodiesterase [Brevundimonas goettingensis]QTC91752.1 alkaline phosphatase family protein [Brevundimonas goettingensis]
MLARLIAALSVTVTLVLAGCASISPVDAGRAETPRPLVILISIDGFRYDYLTRGATPTLSALAADGATGPMRPSFPSLTFPNHYTLVTGLHPDHHGIVGNSFIDPGMGRFTMARTEEGWWDQAEPIWISAQKAGLTAATMFWPGSESENHGLRPHYYRPFDKEVTGDQRVDQLLAWLDDTPRPDLGTLYFDLVDTAGHDNGPDAPETMTAAASVDASIARLIEGLKARGLYDNTVLVVVADHGMAATSPDRVVYLDDFIDPAAVTVLYGSAVPYLQPVEGREAEAEAALVGRHPHLECWRKADIPARFVLGSNPRVPPIVCSAEVGWVFATRARPLRRAGGAHGYDNQAPEMAALFIAHGPGVAHGRTLRNLDSVDVQPLLGRLLGIPVPPGDGRLADSGKALQ